MTLKLFYDLLSQPSRTLYIFLKINNIPFEAVPVALRKGEHLTEEFKEKYSKFGKVPFIHDGNFRLSESVAIIRYLAETRKIADHWYPRDIKERAKVDEYLEWQHLNTRANCALYFLRTVVEPMMTGAPPTESRVKRLKKNMENSLKDMETLWLANDKKYITGDKISVADIFAATEIEQTRMAGYDPRAKYPILEKWLERVKKETDPFYTESHVFVDKLAAKSKL